MFSGIVEAIGTILQMNAINGCKDFIISHAGKFTDLAIGDSVAVNGICLTVTAFDELTLSVTAVPETLRITNLDFLNIGDLVNLERSVTLNSRIGGHQVQGHVDGIGKILAIQPEGEALLVKISIPLLLSRYIVPKGYITLDGMSITVIQATAEWFTVTFIPHTQAVTVVKNYQVGSLVNIEVDIVGKYIEKLLGAYTYANIH